MERCVEIVSEATRRVPGDLKAKFPEQPWHEIAAMDKGAAMRISAKGQVTISKDVRERAGLMPGTDVEFEIEAGVVRLVKARMDGRRRTRGQKLVESLRGRGDDRSNRRGDARPFRRRRLNRRAMILAAVR